ncbi:hypothetical protein Vretimale_15630 [Volvox reticuliferus]|uniref:Nudix hydrolase domain-containing protein n=2 Tax=Volvox reticuliferus TaxID=1737510 RepID=A0A8J4LWD1_9CHLO|nr:hypothetical protein Vretifemale_15016 [Volvox reticuliferus]GIM12249.1 hypothetical protein Vretimale_15630 [Volvox reticuliferus]
MQSTRLLGRAGSKFTGNNSRRETGVVRMAGSFTYQYPRPAVTVDTIIVSRPRDRVPPQLLLIKRKNPPYKDTWALPGGFVDEGEGLDAAAGRELQEETSVDPTTVSLTQVGAFGDPGRDPRGWTITVAYAALVPSTNLGVRAADDAKDARWFDVSMLPVLAFDHKLVVRTALRQLAKQPTAAAVAGLPAILEAAANKLEGPWRTEFHRSMSTKN